MDHGPPIPISLLTGFLGSGKTTLLRRLLNGAELANTLVLINELGEIAVDHILVDFIDPTMIVTSSGCICCTVPSELAQTLLRFLQQRSQNQRKFERIIIETTGLADPVPVLTTLMGHPSLIGALRLDSVIVTADAVNVRSQLAAHTEARRQVALADRIVLTKTDVASANESNAARIALREWNRAAAFVGVGAPASSLFGAGLWNPETKLLDARRWMKADAFAEARPGQAARRAATHAGRVDSACLSIEEPISWDVFSSWAENLRVEHSRNLLRLKAVLNLRQDPNPVAVHGVHNLFHPPVALRGWPDEDHRSRVVLIVQGADPHELLDDLAERCMRQSRTLPYLG